jgi:hypothetical protein
VQGRFLQRREIAERLESLQQEALRMKQRQVLFLSDCYICHIFDAERRGPDWAGAAPLRQFLSGAG